MTIKTVADLAFEKQGCCGGESYSDVVHDNGLMTRVTRGESGEYGVVTYAGNAIFRPAQSGLSVELADARIADDAAQQF